MILLKPQSLKILITSCSYKAFPSDKHNFFRNVAFYNAILFAQLLLFTDTLTNSLVVPGSVVK